MSFESLLSQCPSAVLGKSLDPETVRVESDGIVYDVLVIVNVLMTCAVTFLLLCKRCGRCCVLSATSSSKRPRKDVNDYVERSGFG